MVACFFCSVAVSQDIVLLGTVEYAVVSVWRTRWMVDRGGDNIWLGVERIEIVEIVELV